MSSYTIIIKASKLLRSTIFVLALIILPGIKSHAQEPDRFGFTELEGLFEAHPAHRYVFTKNQGHVNNEIDFIMSAGFRFYKSFLSSQDNPSCIFYPSCSEYSISAFQQKGVILGIFYTFDRLSRCHRLVKSGEYFYDETKQLFYDPLR